MGGKGGGQTPNKTPNPEPPYASGGGLKKKKKKKKKKKSQATVRKADISGLAQRLIKRNAHDPFRGAMI